MQRWTRQLIATLLLVGVLWLPNVGAAAANVVPTGAPLKSCVGETIVSTAMQYQGVPYKWGGTSPKGFDCSGFVQYIYLQNGKSLPRTADKQFEMGKPVGVKDLQPGDVVFFTTYEKGPSHCGIYYGQGKFVHASSSHGVTVSLLTDSYWKTKYLGARRLLG